MTINLQNNEICAVCDGCGIYTGWYMIEEEDIMRIDLKNIRWKVNNINNELFRCPQCSGKPIDKYWLIAQEAQIKQLPFGYLID